MVDLGDDLVAKTWHARALGDIERLRGFYSAVGASGVTLATPNILQVLSVDDQNVTIERRLHGRPLRNDESDLSPVVGDVETGCVLEALHALQAGIPTTNMSSLPVLEGERPFSFGENLAALVERRVQRRRAILVRAVPDVDRVVRAVISELRRIRQRPYALVHGDLIPANILVDEESAPVAVLDFGLLSAVGDPRFDAAVATSIFDMYSPRARTNEDILTSAVVAEFGYDSSVLHLYRAAYALVTSNCFSASGTDGHFEWCATMLQRSDVRAAIGL
ncbi:MAG: phosphotransferase [Actinomycetia bacterium]|nr:phosphotransferase [Actinomycetes bacterium]